MDSVQERDEAPTVVLPMADDMHVHLRQSELMDLVTPHVYLGGCKRVLVMPNTQPPIVTCAQALEYRNQLLKKDSRVDFRMTLYLSKHVCAKDLRENAVSSFVTGVKLYPRGVTTNSDDGVEDLTEYRQIFEAMQECGLVLHIHGEAVHASALSAEASFLPTLYELRRCFPSLKIVLEHVSTAAGVHAVKGMPNTAATITAHHLRLTVDDVLTQEGIQHHKTGGQDAAWKFTCNPFNFCKPLPKLHEDRAALLEVVREGHPQFFLGSDSAPHPKRMKVATPPAAGVYTQPFLLAYLADTFVELGCVDKLKAFVCENAANFFGFPKHELKPGEDCVVLKPGVCRVPQSYKAKGSDLEVVPFLAGKELGFSIVVTPFTQEMRNDNTFKNLELAGMEPSNLKRAPDSSHISSTNNEIVVSLLEMDFSALASGGAEVEEQLRKMERAIDDLNMALIEIKSNPPKDTHTKKQQQLRIQRLKQELLPGEMSELLKRQQKLQQQFEHVSSECDAHLVSVSMQQLLERYDRNHGSPHVDTLSPNPQQQRQQVVKMGDQTQDQAQASLIRTQQMVAETEEVGGTILQKMQQQNEQLEGVREGLDDVEQNLSRAKKTAQTIAKNAANDRCMQCLCCCVTLLAIASIVLVALPGHRS